MHRARIAIQKVTLLARNGLDGSEMQSTSSLIQRATSRNSTINFTATQSSLSTELKILRPNASHLLGIYLELFTRAYIR